MEWHTQAACHHCHREAHVPVVRFMQRTHIFVHAWPAAAHLHASARHVSICMPHRMHACLPPAPAVFQQLEVDYYLEHSKFEGNTLIPDQSRVRTASTATAAPTANAAELVGRRSLAWQPFWACMSGRACRQHAPLCQACRHTHTMPHLHVRPSLAPLKQVWPVVRMFGVTKAGNSVCAYVHNFEPYFYIERPNGWGEEHLHALQEQLNVRRDGGGSVGALGPGRR